MSGNDNDEMLLEVLRRALEGGTARLHVSYHRARKVDGFKASLTEQVGARAVLIRDKFMGAAVTLLFIWFLVAEGLSLHDYTARVLGSPLTYGFISFAIVLLALVLFYRRFVRPIQGPPMHRAAVCTTDLFLRLWQAGAVAIMVREGPDRICQAPKGDWRRYVRETVAG